MKTMYLIVHLHIDNPEETVPSPLHRGFAEVVFRKYFPQSDIGRFIEQNRISYFLPSGADMWWARVGPPVRDIVTKASACVAINVSEDDEMVIRLRTSSEMLTEHPVYVRVLQ